MKRWQAYPFQIEPNGEQLRALRRFAGSCRFVYNKVLATQKALYERGEKKLGYAGLCKLVTEWRNRSETPWLKDSPVHTLQQTAKDSERAYQNFFEKRADFPRFKKKGRSSDSFRYPDPKQFKIDQGNSRIFLPKLGWIRYRKAGKSSVRPRTLPYRVTAGNGSCRFRPSGKSKRRYRYRRQPLAST